MENVLPVVVLLYCTPSVLVSVPVRCTPEYWGITQCKNGQHDSTVRVHPIRIRNLYFCTFVLLRLKFNVRKTKVHGSYPHLSATCLLYFQSSEIE